jgi:hypothetical protein
VVAAVVWLVVVVVALAALLVLTGWVTLPSTGRRAVGSAPRDRAAVAHALADARWSAAHDEQDGVTRILLRRSCTGPDGWPLVLEERVFATIPASAPDWEPRFTEAMAQARYRCEYLNTEDTAG